MKNLFLFLSIVCWLLSSSCNKDDATFTPVVSIAKIEQGCDQPDSINNGLPLCDCFTMEELEELYNFTPWPFGWYSDNTGSCKKAPYDQLMEVWLTNVGQPSQNFNFSAQAGSINGTPFASCSKFNNLSGQFDKYCGGRECQQLRPDSA